MSPVLKNIIAIILGIIVGSIVNSGIVQLGHFMMPVEGLDPDDWDSLVKIMPTLDFKYFIPPFLAHAVGTLVGAFTAAKIAATKKKQIALAIGVWFLLFGIVAVFLIPAPIWFIVLDLALAYIPMAWVGGKLATKN